jgi:hypothetical protein
MKTLSAILLVLLVTNQAKAWGKEGNIIVAQIAEYGLTAKTKAELKKLGFNRIGTDEVANYADKVRCDPWHFVDIPFNEVKTFTDAERFIDEHRPNVCTQIYYFSRILKNPSANLKDKQEAVKFLVNFVGDIHQPLNCCTRADRGGSTLKIRYNGKAGNLHYIWDTNLVLEATRGAPLNNVSRIWYEDNNQLEVEDNPVRWAYESYLIAVAVAYKQDGSLLPTDGTVDLNQSYIDTGAKCVKIRIQKAGLRLANLLNRILGT